MDHPHRDMQAAFMQAGKIPSPLGKARKGRAERPWSWIKILLLVIVATGGLTLAFLGFAAFSR